MNKVIIKEEMSSWDDTPYHYIQFSDDDCDSGRYSDKYLVDSMDTEEMVILFLSIFSPDTNVTSGCIDNTIDCDYDSYNGYKKDDEKTYDVYCLLEVDDENEKWTIYVHGNKVIPLGVSDLADDIPPYVKELIGCYNEYLFLLKGLAGLMEIECEFIYEGEYKKCETIKYKGVI